MEKKHATSIRLSTTGKRLLTLISARAGVSKTAILELLIRERAKNEGVK